MLIVYLFSYSFRQKHIYSREYFNTSLPFYSDLRYFLLDMIKDILKTYQLFIKYRNKENKLVSRKAQRKVGKLSQSLSNVD